MFLNPLHVSAQVLTAQELKYLAALSPTSLEYDESKVYEDFFPIGEVRSRIFAVVSTGILCVSFTTLATCLCSAK